MLLTFLEVTQISKQRTFIKRWPLVTCLSLVLVSCASLGSKTLYHNESSNIPRNATVAVAPPTIVNLYQSPAELKEIVASIGNAEFEDFAIRFFPADEVLPSFDEVLESEQIVVPANINADYLLFSKVERLMVENYTRDAKVEYKLVSSKTGKLIFHSKFNTTFGSAVVWVPGVSTYPDTDKIVLMGLSSGFNQIKKRLIGD